MSIYSSLVDDERELSEQILKEMYKDEEFIDIVRKEKSILDIQWTLRFLRESMISENHLIFIEYIKWLKKLFEGLHFELYHVDLMIESIKKVIQQHYPEYEIEAYLNDVFDNKSQDKGIPLSKDANAYLKHLLQIDRLKAEEYIENLIQAGMPLNDIYVHVLQPALYEVGNLWHTNQISVGMEHYCTAMTQYIMSKMYSKIFSEKRNGKKMLACAVGSELHEVGIRMVTDLFALDGWDTIFLGSNLPNEEIIKIGIEFQPDIIALSITMPYHVSKLIETIDSIRKEPALAKTKIMVGGLPFHNNEELVRKVNADGYANDAVEGLKVAYEIL